MQVILWIVFRECVLQTIEEIISLTFLFLPSFSSQKYFITLIMLFEPFYSLPQANNLFSLAVASGSSKNSSIGGWYSFLHESGCLVRRSCNNGWDTKTTRISVLGEFWCTTQMSCVDLNCNGHIFCSYSHVFVNFVLFLFFVFCWADKSKSRSVNLFWSELEHEVQQRHFYKE